MKPQHAVFTMAFLLVVPSVASAATAVFRDVASSEWYAPYVREAVERGFVSGYDDARGNPTGLFEPGNPVTIAEMSKMVSLSQELLPVTGVARENFPADWKAHWAYEYLLDAAGDGKLSLRGDRELAVDELDLPATRGEVAHIIGLGYLISPTLDTWRRPYRGVFRDVQKGHPYRVEIEYLASIGLLTGDLDANGNATGYFRPDDSVNRAEAVKMILRAREIYSQEQANAS